jgi:hypothetical protein
MTAPPSAPDLVARLRRVGDSYLDEAHIEKICAEAAAEIERLRAELEDLKECYEDALHPRR